MQRLPDEMQPFDEMAQKMDAGNYSQNDRSQNLGNRKILSKRRGKENEINECETDIINLKEKEHK